MNENKSGRARPTVINYEMRKIEKINVFFVHT